MHNFSGERLKSARIYRGMTITDIAEKVSVSKQAISQFENGKVQPKLETLWSLSRVLGFPREFFYQKDNDDAYVGTTYFRALYSTTKAERLLQIEKIKYLGHVIHFLNQYVEFPVPRIPNFDVHEINSNRIEAIALELRQFWGVGQQPIPNVISLLEENGFYITSLPTDNQRVDAFSQKQVWGSGNEYNIIVLGDDKHSATRRQFDGAHELGHRILHHWAQDLEEISKEEFRSLEDQANLFAGAFLLPKFAFLRDLIRPNKLDSYVALKKKWRVSISAMIVRAYQLGAIQATQYQYLMKQIARKGWRTQEPLDAELPIPNPTLLKGAIELLLTHEVFTGTQFIQELSKDGLAMELEELEMLLGLAPGTLRDPTQDPSSLLYIRGNNESASQP